MATRPLFNEAGRVGHRIRVPRAQPPASRPRFEARIVGVHAGIADHLGWAVVVTASADHDVVDRRRIELIEPGLSPAPVEHEAQKLDVDAAAALVARVRASVVRTGSAAFDELARSLSAPILSIS